MKTNIIFLVIIVLLGFVWWNGQRPVLDSSNFLTEEEFNQSGQVKAVESEIDLWNFYEVDGTDLSFKYPHNISFAGREMQLFVENKRIDDLDYPGFDKELVLATAESLKNGEFGDSDIFVLESSKKVRSLGEINAQEYMVLSRFEVCDVTFERKALFFENDRRIIITVKGNKDAIVASTPDFFEKNKENCGDELIWNFDKMNEFYQILSEGKGSSEAQEWFNSFDKIMGTIEFGEEQIINTKNLLEGQWVSAVDSKSLIEFVGNERIEYYNGQELRNIPIAWKHF
ncbi:MAG: hypothetical protein V1851_00810 [Patescibacteria group bacterium]